MSKTLPFAAIVVGDVASFEVVLTQEAVTSFAKLSGDENPLHVDESYAAQTLFGRRVVHGMYLGALVSRLVGMELPGTKALLVRESLTFKEPAFIGDTVVVAGEVVHKSEALQLITMAITIIRKDEVLAEGEVLVRVLP
jgi:3-hydroxybutyryl-CoA dehydratase